MTSHGTHIWKCISSCLPKGKTHTVAKDKDGDGNDVDSESEYDGDKALIIALDETQNTFEMGNSEEIWECGGFKIGHVV